ncbi:MAG: UDP-2,3-diacylglucosamine diphosphatase LpxI [Candidatus Omnitrophica bacterium]|nr:UDP-2,3-diacylglucosamine diphosphatase LpxI [Candidatus Omnitrophota bacterium]
MATIGLVAGSGKLPAIFSDSARQRGDKVIGIGLKGVTPPEIENHVDKFIWFELAALQKMIFAAVSNRITKIVLLGKLRKDIFFKNTEGFDEDTRKILGKLTDKKDYSMLNKVSETLSKFGMEVLDPTPYLKDYMPSKGVLTRRHPSEDEAKDLEYARKIALENAGRDIGQAVAVKNRTVIAIEAVEGTDEMIARAGSLSGRGFVVAKVARPEQDMRFDVPLVGLETVEALVKAGATALSIEAGRTFLIDREEIIKLADEKSLSIVIV